MQRLQIGLKTNLENVNSEINFKSMLFFVNGKRRDERQGYLNSNSGGGMATVVPEGPVAVQCCGPGKFIPRIRIFSSWIQGQKDSGYRNRIHIKEFMYL
jgi:hypothetical protein